MIHKKYYCEITCRILIKAGSKSENIFTSKIIVIINVFLLQGLKLFKTLSAIIAIMNRTAECSSKRRF